MAAAGSTKGYMGKRKVKDPLEAIIDYAMTADPAELKAAAIAFNQIVLRRLQPQNGRAAVPGQSGKRRRTETPAVSNPSVAGYNEANLAGVTPGTSGGK